MSEEPKYTTEQVADIAKEYVHLRIEAEKALNKKDVIGYGLAHELTKTKIPSFKKDVPKVVCDLLKISSLESKLLAHQVAFLRSP